MSKDRAQRLEKISLGTFLSSYAKESHSYSDDDYADIADDFAVYAESYVGVSDISFRQLELLARTGQLDLCLQRWLLAGSSLRGIKERFTLSNEPHTAKLVYTLYCSVTYEMTRGLPFVIGDCCEHFSSFIYVESLCSTQSGEGVKLLQKLSDMFSGIIVLNAGCLLRCDYDKFSEGLIADPVDTIIGYYKHAGFKVINDIVGQYEESCVMTRFNDNWEYFVKPEHKELWSIIVDDKPVSEHTSSGLVESIKEEIKAHAESKGLSYDAMCTIIYRAIPTLLREYYESVEDAAVLEWQNYKRVNGIV